jgi:hypothetical protein
MNYKNDESYFITVFAPFTFYGTAVKEWFRTEPWAQYRFIRDHDAEQEFWNAQQVYDTYQDVKMISIAVNPWARMRYAYEILNTMKSAGSTQIDFSLIKLDDFDEFIEHLYYDPFEGKRWFSFNTPMSRWFDYEENNKTKTVDYLIKDYSLQTDFNSIQEYFQSTNTLTINNNIKYHQYYNKVTQKVVEDIFIEDINRFDFNF